MQILRLELSGIGPYAGTEHVDFSRLGADGLFLLEGATGSGKTTIIDAIVFALYGQVAADDSSGDRMVSTHRKAASEPYVDLVVDTSRGLYRVRRTPQFTRPKKRGEGLTSVNATIRLWKLADPDDQDGEPISANIQDANKELQAAIGLSRDQFTQTVVLPQGHFANFLRSKPEERRGLLQQIFGTELFERAQQELTAMAADYKARADQARTQIRSLAERFAHSAWPDEAPTPDGSPASEATPVPADETPAGHQDVPAAGPTPREAFLALLDDDDTAPLVAAAHARLRELQADTEQRTQAVAGARERLGGARAARDAAQRIIALKAEHDALVVQRQGLEARGDQIAADRVRLDAATRAAGSARPLAAARRAASALSTATTEWEVVAAEIAATDDGVLLEQVRPHAVGNLGSPDGSDDAALSTLRDEITRLGTTRGQLGQLAQLEAGLPARHARLDADNARLAEITARITTTQQELAELIAGRDELSQRHGQLPPTDDALTSASLTQQSATRTLEAAQAAE
ncbi:MAG: AAA family ATPase, partial [Propionibacterium sp.]|nr:AAA family ATPase [Propionibacterium sp.]